MKRIEKFFSQGDKVKLVMQFRGREMAHLDTGRDKFKSIIEEVKEMGAIAENELKVMGNRIVATLSADKALLKKYMKKKYPGEKG